MVKRRNILPIVLLVLLLVTFSFAHEGEIEEAHPGPMDSAADAHAALLSKILWTLGIAAFFAVSSVIAALAIRKKNQATKLLLFCFISIPVALATLYLTYSTVRLNIMSETGGPVHWHADFGVFVCGEKKELINPVGLSNLRGDPILHEHDDNRIHVEGVLMQKRHASLYSFFKTVGGFLNNEQFIFPTPEKIISVTNGEKCPAGHGGVLQVFVYQTHDGLVMQHKLENAAAYVLSPHNTVPPGDCIIVEFDYPKEKTDELCESYRIALQRGDVHGS